jgi:hypothetical protein
LIRRRKAMFRKGLPFTVYIVLGCLVLLSLPIFLGDCGGSAGAAENSVVPPRPPTPPDPRTAPNGLNENGILNTVQAYINTAYPESAKKTRALLIYAQKLQYAHLYITTPAEANNFEPEIIKSLICLRLLGADISPISKVGDLTVGNSPESLERALRYGELLRGKGFTVSYPGETVEDVCDFDPNSLPN